MNNNSQITLVEQTSLEVADVKRAKREYDDEFDAAIEDGIISPDEVKRLKRRRDNLDREIEEASLVAREAAYVQKENDFRMKRGTHATPHYYLLREKREIQAMGGLKDYPATKAKAPQVVRGQVRLVSNR